MVAPATGGMPGAVAPRVQATPLGYGPTGTPLTKPGASYRPIQPKLSWTPSHPAGATGERSVHVGRSRTVCPAALFVTLKWPAQFTPFMSQNCGLAAFVVPGADQSCSSGALSSLERRLLLASDL